MKLIRLAAFVRSLLPSGADVDDVVQNTNSHLWRNASEFKPGTDFRAWLFQVVNFQVLSLRKQVDRWVASACV
jgi:RNA polymerase sigma-70 factor (ECF subfamily)